MIFPERIIKEARVTEKSTELSSRNQYTFEVYKDVNRIAVKQAIQKMFNVKVLSVNILNSKGKQKRVRARSGGVFVKNRFKKAIVTLAEGHKIELI